MLGHSSPQKCGKNEAVTFNEFSFGDTLYETLRELSKEKKMSYFKPIPLRDYKSCTLTEGKDWVITYYVTNPDTGKLKRCRIRLNRIKSIRERRQAARVIMAGIDQRLALGWNPLMESKSPKAFEKLYDAFNAYLKVKDHEMESASTRIYTSFIKTFTEWLELHGFDSNSYANSVTYETAMLFMDDIELTHAPKTYNNYIGFFRGMFGWMREKGYTSINPFDNISKKPKRLMKKNRRMLTDDELSRMLQFVRKTNREYMAMCLICYCCFIRPKEIALLRCKDIDLKKQLIHVASEIAKNDNESYRTIPDDLMPIMQSLDLSNPEWFLFGHHAENPQSFAPSKVMLSSRRIAQWWDRNVRPACGFKQDVKFYSLKDTGITNMLEKGVSINLVQKQADHSSVAMTAIYVGKKPEANKQLKEAKIINMVE